MTAETAVDVYQRDGGCLAVTLGGLDPASCRGRLQLDHVKDQPKIGDPIVKRPASRKRRYRAPSDAAHLATVCEHHHLDGWATSHRPELRAYLEGSCGR